MDAAAVGAARQAQQPQAPASKDRVIALFQAVLTCCWIGGAIWLSRESKLAPKLMLGVALPLQLAIGSLRRGAPVRDQQVAAAEESMDAAEQQQVAARRLMGPFTLQIMNAAARVAQVEQTIPELLDEPTRVRAGDLLARMRQQVADLEAAQVEHFTTDNDFGPAFQKGLEATTEFEREYLAIWQHPLQVSQANVQSMIAKYSTSASRSGRNGGNPF
jgi:hypothetical protein